MFTHRGGRSAGSAGSAWVDPGSIVTGSTAGSPDLPPFLRSKDNKVTIQEASVSRGATEANSACFTERRGVLFSYFLPLFEVLLTSGLFLLTSVSQVNVNELQRAKLSCLLIV